MIYDDILKAIRDEYKTGATQAELAQKYRCSQVHLGRLLSGKRSVEKISMETFFKIFPRAKINLDSGVHSSVVNTGLNMGHMINGNATHDDVIQKILSDDSLSSDEKIKVLKVLIPK